MSEEKIYLYPAYIRVWHLCNAIFCLLLILTGISMQFSNPEFPLIRFDVAVSVHNILGVLLSVSYFIFLIGNLFSGNGRFYRIEIRGMYTRLKAQFVFYTLGIFRSEPAPFPITRENKFNPLQQFTYVGTMYLFIPVIFFTGWFLMYPDVFIPLKVFGFSGLHLTDLIHVAAGFLVSVFMFIHVYFCTIGKTPVSNFKSMIDGYH